VFFVRLATARYAKASPERVAAALWTPLMRFMLKNPDWGPRKYGSDPPGVQLGVARCAAAHPLGFGTIELG